PAVASGSPPGRPIRGLDRDPEAELLRAVEEREIVRPRRECRALAVGKQRADLIARELLDRRQGDDLRTARTAAAEQQPQEREVVARARIQRAAAARPLPRGFGR